MKSPLLPSPGAYNGRVVSRIKLLHFEAHYVLLCVFVPNDIKYTTGLIVIMTDLIFFLLTLQEI